MVTLISAILVWFLVLRATFGVRFTMVGVNATDSLDSNRTRKDPFWLEAIKHQGIAPFHPNASSYSVFRNVKDYGAKGDGVADDTEAIKYGSLPMMGVLSDATMVHPAWRFQVGVVVARGNARPPRTGVNFCNRPKY